MEDVKMNDYVILTDSSCDLPDDIVKKYQLEILQLDFIVEGEEVFIMIRQILRKYIAN